ncbi:MAG: TerB N-terminal domain-containing protein [Anaerolineaceae bacterium]|jgi:hypothetical protein
MYKSNNTDSVISRIGVAKETLRHLLIYEQKGIGIFKPMPSQLLADIEREQDSIIFDAFSRASATLRSKLLNLKSTNAKISNASKFISKINEALPLMKNPSGLIDLRNSFSSKENETPGNILNKEIEETGINEKSIVKTKAIRIKELHPAKLLIIERDSKGRTGGLGGVRISVNITGNTQVEIIGPEEPSTIYKDLPVHRPPNPDVIDRPPYYPSFIQLSPEQRWIYLHWLDDISQPINIGYVFIYFYGLERQLLVGDFETAFNEVIFLRHCHDNNSFESYSYNALLYSSAIRNRPDLVLNILSTESRNGIGNEDLLFKHYFNLGIDVEEMMSLAKKIKGTNLRYIKAVPKLYRAALTRILIDKYGDKELPIYSLFEIDKVPKISTIAFANISFSDNLRNPKIPNFLHYDPFITDSASLFASAHELVKEDLKKDRLINE